MEGCLGYENHRRQECPEGLVVRFGSHVGRQGVPHGRCRIHEGTLPWDDASIWDMVLVYGPPGYHRGVSFHGQEVGGDGDIAKLYLVHHQNASVCTSFLEGFPLELGLHT